MRVGKLPACLQILLPLWFDLFAFDKRVNSGTLVIVLNKRALISTASFRTSSFSSTASLSKWIPCYRNRLSRPRLRTNSRESGTATTTATTATTIAIVRSCPYVPFAAASTPTTIPTAKPAAPTNMRSRMTKVKYRGYLSIAFLIIDCGPFVVG